MKYYLIEITDGDTKIKGKAVYEYDSKTKAVAAFHKKLGAAMDSGLYTSALIMVIDEFGNVIEEGRHYVPTEIETINTEESK